MKSPHVPVALCSAVVVVSLIAVDRKTAREHPVNISLSGFACCRVCASLDLFKGRENPIFPSFSVWKSVRSTVERKGSSINWPVLRYAPPRWGYHRVSGCCNISHLYPEHHRQHRYLQCGAQLWYDVCISETLVASLYICEYKRPWTQPVLTWSFYLFISL